MEKTEEIEEKPEATTEEPAKEETTEVKTEEKPVEKTTEEEKVEDLEPEVRKKDVEKEENKGDDEVEIDPEDEKSIGKVVDKKLKPVNDTLKEIARMKDEREVDSYIQDNPDFKKYRGSILKHISHPAYSNIPVANIAAMVASRDLMKIGAKKEREAAAKAKETQNNTTTVRKSTGPVDWSKVSKAEFEAEKARVLGQV